MKKTLQRIERTKYYDLAICCTYCGQKVVPGGDEELVVAACPHTLFVAHDTGFEYISPQVAVQLRDRGYEVDIGNDGFVEIDHDDESQPLSPDELTDSLEFADGSKVASYEAAPGEMGTYVGFAPIEHE